MGMKDEQSQTDRTDRTHGGKMDQLAEWTSNSNNKKKWLASEDKETRSFEAVMSRHPDSLGVTPGKQLTSKHVLVY